MGEHFPRGAPGTRFSCRSYLIIRPRSSPPALAAGIVRLLVTPDRVERIEPVNAQMSILLPDRAGVHKDVITSFCHFVHFFPSRQAGESWSSQHPGTFLLSIYEA